MRKNEYEHFCKICKLFPEQFNCNLLKIDNKDWGITLINSKLEYGLVYTNRIRASDFYKKPEELFEKEVMPFFVHMEQPTFYKRLQIKRSDRKRLINVLTNY